jgi:penicillin-binding protein 2
MRRKKSLGLSFSDNLSKATIKSGHFSKGKFDEWSHQFLPNFDPNAEEVETRSIWPSTTLLTIGVILFFGLILRLFHLQMVQGSLNRGLADGNRIQIKIIHAPRGVVYDRSGKILADNSPGFRLVDPKTKKAQIISREEALALEVNNDPKATQLEIDNIRSYPKGEEFSHVLGYVGEITEDQLKDSSYGTYRPGDRIGQTGIESQYEDLLRGKDGGEIIEVDAQGRKIRTLRDSPPVPGQNLTLSIDADLQHQAYLALKDSVTKAGSCCGTAIAEDPKTGQLMAMVNYPSYDNNLFTKNRSDSALSEVLTRSDHPLLNRAIAGTYPPGSTYKIVSSIAALESGQITPQTIFEDTGQIFLGSFKFTNWYFTEYGKTEGPVDLVKAIKRSNDIYYYQVGQKISEKPFIDWSKKLNLGSPLGIDLPGEAKGLIPDGSWKEKNYDQPWYPGDTLHMAIGQGFTLTTPLQVLGFTSFIASNGVLYQPHLLLKATDPFGKITSQFLPKPLAANIVKPEYIKVIQQGLEQVPQYGGTGWPFFTFPIKTAGKTGTAEFGDPKNKTHGWYTAYGPADDPKLAVTVLIEAGGEGSNVAAPVAKELFRWYLSSDKNNLIKDINTVATESAKVLGE